MITAEEFLKSKGYISNNHKFDREIEFLIEFAKLHIKNFSKLVSENARVNSLNHDLYIINSNKIIYNDEDATCFKVDKNSIIDYYNEYKDNII